MKDTIKKIKKIGIFFFLHRQGEKSLKKRYLIRIVIQNIQVTVKTQENKQLSKKSTKDIQRHLTKKVMQIASKHMKKCFPLSVVREIQIKTKVNCHYLPTIAEI